MSVQQGKILVIRGGAIGDFILTLPAIAALREQFPTSRLEVLGYPHIAQLAVAAGWVDHVRSIEAAALAGFFAKDGSLAKELQDYFASFNIIVSYLYDPDGVFQANVVRCGKAQFLVGPHRPNEREELHAAKAFLKPLERLAIFEADSVPRFRLPEPTATLQKLVALHPGSGSEKKNWPEAKWADLLDQLAATTTLKFLIVGGEAEGERLQRLAARLPVGRGRAVQSLPLVELAGLLRTCVGFIGHDSGISHLAAAVGLNGVLLWGESDEKIWRPPSQRMIVLRDPHGLEHLDVDQVFKEIQKLPRIV